ncbi:MAG: DUF1269 domain-containing protein [Chloroflexota bacterium]|nr:MAG: DUF1269 domain-containing protein [Chloroflexota bacterium]
MMKEIPLDAQVHCRDGQAGTSTHIILDPTSRIVTHFVVVDDEPVVKQHYLVPIELVTETRGEAIYLACTKEELARQEPFVETRYVENPGMEAGYPADSVYLAPYVSPLDLAYVPVEVERIPMGEVALHRGAVVEASDGYVGQLGELLLDPDSGAITHFILQEGHAWGKKEIALPVSAVDETQENTIILKLDKESVGKLPAIPARRDYGSGEDAWATELLAKMFGDEEQASAALKHVKQMASENGASFRLRDAAVLVKDADGKTKIKETADLDAKQGRLFGAVVGGLIGLMGGPVGVVIGALAGAGAGAFGAKHIDMGFSDEFLQGLEDHLEPGSSALLVLVDHREGDEIFQSLAAGEGVLMHHALTDAIIEELTAAAEDEADGGGQDGN